MSRAHCYSDMLQGYFDGFAGDLAPGANRSHSYRHGWLNGRDDRYRQPRASAEALRKEAEAAIEADISAAQLGGTVSTPP